MQLGMFSQDMHDFLEAVVRGRKNMLISGGTGSGKSTLLGALAEAIPDRERIVTIEDSAELILDQEHVVRMETRPANIEGRGRITARDLVINALRMRPDRIIVGEVRGGEALDMLQAMNTGPRRRHDHGPRQQPARRLRAAGDDGPDGRAGPAVAGDPRADRLGAAPDRPRAALRGRRAAAWRASPRSSGMEGLDAADCKTSSASSGGGQQGPADRSASSSPRASCRGWWRSLRERGIEVPMDHVPEDRRVEPASLESARN